MAEIVVGIAASHSPQLSSGVDMWEDHGERDRNKTDLLGRDGEYHDYEFLLAAADPLLKEELAPEVWQSKYLRAQAAIDELAASLAGARPDVAVVIGDDQWELFREEGVPAFGLFQGEELWDEPRRGEEERRMAEGVRRAQWAVHGDRRNTHRIDAGLSRHLTAELCEHGFDIFCFSRQNDDRSLGHAFTFPRYRLGLDEATPIVPIFINTYFPPNSPSAERCYRLGRVIRRGIDSWPRRLRVAVITSGGLSHFVVDEKLDRRVLAAIETRDHARLESLPRKHMRSGNSEILNWVAAAGVLEGMSPEVIDYIPGYRTPAGTGTGMAFARWK